MVMEGLIPLVIHAIKRRRQRNNYLDLSTSLRFQDVDQREAELVPSPPAPTEFVREYCASGSSRRHHWPHRRGKSELPQLEPDRRIVAPSRSLREGHQAGRRLP